jgi:hypothetical protein
MSRDEMCEIGEIYESIYKESMTSAAVVGDSVGLEGGSVENTDSYAKGTTVIPTVLGMQRRNKINNIFDPLKHQKKSSKLSKSKKSVNKIKKL